MTWWSVLSEPRTVTGPYGGEAPPLTGLVLVGLRFDHNETLWLDLDGLPLPRRLHPRAQSGRHDAVRLELQVSPFNTTEVELDARGPDGRVDGVIEAIPEVEHGALIRLDGPDLTIRVRTIWLMASARTYRRDDPPGWLRC